MQAIRYVNPQELKNHPLSIEVYGDLDLNDEFVESLKNNGVLEPIQVAEGNRVIGGHRRRAGAIKAGLERVPVVDVITNDPLELEKMVIELNRQRVKSREQKAREYKELKRIEQQISSKLVNVLDREESGAPVGASRNSGRKKRASGRASAAERAAQQVGLDPSTAEAAAEVVDEVDRLQAAGEPERAQELRNELNEGTVRGAQRKARQGKQGGSAGEPAAAAQDVDEVGTTIPVQLAVSFQAAEDFDKALGLLKSAKALVKALTGRAGGDLIAFTTVEADFGNIRRHLQFARPHAVCPSCKAGKKQAGCQVCKGLGWIGKLTHDEWLKQHPGK